MSSAPTVCARCGHSVARHGRRGRGACRHGWSSPLEVATAMVVASVRLGLDKKETHDLVDKAFNEPHEPCQCKRFRKTAPKSEGTNVRPQ